MHDRDPPALARTITMRDVLLASIADARDEMVELTGALMAIPTENPPGTAYDQAIELLVDRLDALGFDDTRVVGSCVLSFAGRGDRTLYFSGHYDVVPAQRADQFDPIVRDGKLIGRGSSDMKSGLAAMIHAARALRDAGALEDRRIGLVLVPDEETAGPNGSRALVECGLLGANGIGMLTPEPTGGVVWNANRGAITLEVTVRGRSAHVGQQHTGVNAFENAVRVVHSLMELKAEVEQRRTNFHIAPDAARHSILMIGGATSGGSTFNLVPDRFSFTVERRINPEENLEAEKARVLEVLDRARAFADLEVRVFQEGLAAGVSESEDLGVALGNAIQRVTGRPARFEMCGGLVETRFYAERGIPAYAYGPGLLTVSHGPNEFVPINRIVECAQIYALTALEAFSAHDP
jgi:succinyl-diaminopimelate desuccinylase